MKNAKSLSSQHSSHKGLQAHNTTRQSEMKIESNIIEEKGKMVQLGPRQTFKVTSAGGQFTSRKGQEVNIIVPAHAVASTTQVTVQVRKKYLSGL